MILCIVFEVHVNLNMSYLYRMASAQSKEESVFANHYSQLHDTLTDIDSLLPYFVEGDIFSESKLNEMKSLKSIAKVTRLLVQISNRLKAGNTKAFYAISY